MALLNDFFQYSIFVLVGICLLTLIFLGKNKNHKSSYMKQANAQNSDALLQQLKNELQSALAEKVSLEKENQRLLHELEEIKHTNNKKFNNWRQNKNNEAIIEAEIRKCPSKYYKTKLTLMNRPESRMFFYITESIKKISNSKDQDFYILFPQVNLYAFIDQNPNLSISEDKSELLLKVLGGKNVDFILCYCHSDHYPSDTFNFYFYTPILMVEIDGPGHFYPIHSSYQKTRKNDQLKNTLANELKLPLLRYRLRLPKGNIEATDKAGIHTALRRFFSDYNAKQTESIYYYDQNGALSKNQYYNPPIDQT